MGLIFYLDKVWYLWPYPFGPHTLLVDISPTNTSKWIKYLSFFSYDGYLHIRGGHAFYLVSAVVIFSKTILKGQWNFRIFQYVASVQRFLSPLTLNQVFPSVFSFPIRYIGRFFFNVQGVATLTVVMFRNKGKDCESEIWCKCSEIITFKVWT